MLPTKKSNQEVFDRVVVHARHQNCKSENGSICLYRGPNGTKCFVGALITDESYDHSLETNTVVEHDVRKALQASGINITHQFFLRDLQKIHDLNDVCSWEDSFKDFAHKYDLTYTAPTGAV